MIILCYHEGQFLIAGIYFILLHLQWICILLENLYFIKLSVSLSSKLFIYL